jgi:hypothetical protein
MGYIIKENQGLLITRLTDTGRKKISEGNFNVSYFQIGDSEVNYNTIANYDITNFQILEPSYNAQNSTGVPQSTKNDVKYPFYLQGSSGLTYGIPFMASSDESVFNTAAPNGFFSANTASTCYSPYHTSAYTYNSQYIVNLSGLTGNTSILNLISNPCGDSASGTTISAGTFVTVFMSGGSSCGCIGSCHPILTYQVQSYNSGTGQLVVDRLLPNLNALGYTGQGRLFFYPSGMTGYDLPTPMNYWSDSVINYESVCTPEDGLVKVWNMNIPWSESPAGLISTIYSQYETFGSVDYIGSKEYYGYMSSSGQTDTSGVTYYNSLGQEIVVTPEEQKAIAIVHYTNNTIINFYGEKFACEAYDSTNPGATGQARNFSINLPWLMWHKNPISCCSGETFWIDPSGFDGYDLLTPYYIQSNENIDMNNPGIRYFHLYDKHPNPDGRPSRVGKVFPDDKVIIFDDEEIIAAMTYVANRNYTLPAPTLGYTAPGLCGDNSTDGLLDNNSQCIWVTYGFDGPWTGMHCNYYQKIIGPVTGCGLTEQNVTVSFGNEFRCMTTGTTTGYSATDFFILAQTGYTTDNRPNPNNWVRISYSGSLTNYIVGGYINPVGLTATTFTISPTTYAGGTTYNLGNELELPTIGSSSNTLYFGDEYSFYGNINTDIQATIYEMRYLINLPNAQFSQSSNPTWVQGITPYMSEIGLYDANKNLLVLSKFQSPQVRQGIQQAVVKLDF